MNTVTALQQTLTYKGKDLKERLKTLKQIMGSQFGKVEQCMMILSSKSSIEIELEYEEQNLAVFGTKAMTTESQFDPIILKEKAEELSDMDSDGVQPQQEGLLRPDQAEGIAHFIGQIKRLQTQWCVPDDGCDQCWITRRPGGCVEEGGAGRLTNSHGRS